MANLPDITHLTTEELLRLWAQVMAGLRDRGVIRSGNNPVGDICEGLVATYYGVSPAGNSNSGYDLITRDGERVQVKGRRTTATSKPSHYSFMRDLPNRPFDALVAVHLDENFGVSAAYRLPWEAVLRLSNYVEHVNAWRLPFIRGPLADESDVERIELTLA